jgi:chain length determinant protein EpsF
MRQQWQETTEGRGTLEVWLAQGLQKKLKVKPGKDSDVINIAFDSPDPAFAAAVANAFARAYIDINVELRTAPARQSAAWFQEQGKVLREALEQAQSRISRYQQDHGIVATDEKLDSETARLSDLSAQLTVVQGQTTDARSRAQSSQSIESMPEVMQSTLITGLKGDIARQEAKLQEASKNLGPNHPQFQRMSAEIESLKARLASEIQKIAGSFAIASTVGQQKEGQLQGAIEAQKRRLLEMKRQRDELGVLMREGETAQKAYDEISRKLTQTSQSNAAVLNPAVESLRPSFPNLPLNLLAALLAGMFLGVIAAFVQEIRDRRVRSLADLELILDLPVLAEVRRPSRFLTVRRPALAAT